MTSFFVGIYTNAERLCKCNFLAGEKNGGRPNCSGSNWKERYNMEIENKEFLEMLLTLRTLWVAKSWTVSEDLCLIWHLCITSPSH